MAAATRNYESQLRKVAKITGQLVQNLHLGPGHTAAAAVNLLESYADLLKPWATRTAWHMLQDIDDRSRDTWRTLGQEISLGLKRTLEHTPVGLRMRSLLREHVEEIVTIPKRAALRVEELTLEAFTNGGRHLELAQKIRDITPTAKYNAIRMARTQVSASATTLMQARAEYIGSEGYIWETVNDRDVRKDHKKLQGKFIRWDSPPTINGYTAHAGQFANGRCWPRPVFDIQ